MKLHIEKIPSKYATVGQTTYCGLPISEYGRNSRIPNVSPREAARLRLTEEPEIFCGRCVTAHDRE